MKQNIIIVAVLVMVSASVLIISQETRAEDLPLHTEHVVYDRISETVVALFAESSDM